MSVEKTCQGCREDQPNQLAHMEPGGCLYEEYVEKENDEECIVPELIKRRIVLKPIKTTCEGCRDNDSNELAHMEPGGCLHRPRYPVDDDYDDYVEVVKKSGEKITIGHVTYYYDKESKILYTDKTLRKAICKYDRITCVLSPL
jgi:hypothetical protein